MGFFTLYSLLSLVELTHVLFLLTSSSSDDGLLGSPETTPHGIDSDARNSLHIWSLLLLVRLLVNARAAYVYAHLQLRPEDLLPTPTSIRTSVSKPNHNGKFSTFLRSAA